MFDDKTKELISLGAATACNCTVCLEYHTAKARRLGITEADIKTAVEVGRMVRKGAAGELDKIADNLRGDDNVK